MEYSSQKDKRGYNKRKTNIMSVIAEAEGWIHRDPLYCSLYFYVCTVPK